MSVLVGAVEMPHLVPTRPLDDHGWAEGNTFTPVDPVRGTIQERIPGANPSGDFGMWEPGQNRMGVAYIDTKVDPGDVLVCEGITWRVRDIRFVKDPRNMVDAACWVCQVEQVRDRG